MAIQPHFLWSNPAAIYITIFLSSVSRCKLLRYFMCFKYVTLYFIELEKYNFFFVYLINALFFQPSRRRNSHAEASNPPTPCKYMNKLKKKNMVNCISLMNKSFGENVPLLNWGYRIGFFDIAYNKNLNYFCHTGPKQRVV